MTTPKAWAVAALALLLAAAPLRAQDKPEAPDGEKPKAVEEKPNVAEEKPKEEKPKASPPATASAEGFVIQSEGGDFRLQVRGYAQLDGRFFPGDAAGIALDTFVLRRVRPIVQGTVGKYFDFNITPDFGAGTTVLQDAYLDVRYTPKFRVRLGKFKSPVGLERLQSAAATTFVERAFPTALVPNRDVGIMLHGELAEGVVAYAMALLDGAPDGGSVDLDLNDSKDLAGRVFLSPFKKGTSALKDLGFGIAGTTGKQTGALPAYRSGGQLSIITLLTGITFDGTRKRYSPQLSFYSGPFGLLAEYAQSDSKVKKADGTRVSLVGKAWQATGTVALTGEKASYAGVRPTKSFDPAKGQWGALELAARVNGIELGNQAVEAGLIDPTKSVRKAFAWAAGLTWSLNRNVKQLLDYERTSFTGGAAGGKDRDPESAIFMRTQISF
jgi:phosphate-selective porin OprO/OprP